MLSGRRSAAKHLGSASLMGTVGMMTQTTGSSSSPDLRPPTEVMKKATTSPPPGGRPGPFPSVARRVSRSAAPVTVPCGEHR